MPWPLLFFNEENMKNLDELVLAMEDALEDHKGIFDRPQIKMAKAEEEKDEKKEEKKEDEKEDKKEKKAEYFYARLLEASEGLDALGFHKSSELALSAVQCLASEAKEMEDEDEDKDEEKESKEEK